MDVLHQHIEALVFCAQQPVQQEELQSVLAEMFGANIEIAQIEEILHSLTQKYSDEKYPFQVVFTGGGYQFLTKAAYQSSIGIFLKQRSKKRLSTSALETLAIIAYKQPISKSQIEQIRGVNCDYAIHKLLEKELVEMKGKAQTPGKPVLYGTTERFMDYFGINSLQDLPTPKDFTLPENEIGTDENA